MNPMSQRALDYLTNAGGFVTIAQFDDDHEPVGPRLREELRKEGLVTQGRGLISREHQPNP